MPPPDAAVVARRGALAAALSDVLPAGAVLETEADRRVYETDGLTAYRQLPMLVALPETVAEVAAVLRTCAAFGAKVVPRGAGTSLSGGALPLADGVLLAMTRFDRILEVDVPNRCVVAQPGVTNLAVTRAVQDRGFFYAPDPSSQVACTLGGNVAENAGGVHCLKYGLTTHNLLGAEMVLMSGETLRLGGKHLDAGGYDLLGAVAGSEGLLGVVTEVTVRILPSPETARALLLGFSTVDDAGDCVAGIVAAGIIPGGMELMDRLAVQAAEAFTHAGYPLDAAAILIVEIDGARPRSHTCATVSPLSPALIAPRRCGPAPTRRSDCACGRAARRPFRRWGGWPRTTTAWTVQSPAPASLKCCGASPSCPTAMVCASPMCFMPATATCTRSSCTTPTRPTSSRAPRRSAPTSCGCAWRWAGCSPASTG